MNLLISWSGRQSQAVARALHNWIPLVVPSIKPWMSTLDISPGGRWFDEVLAQLEQTDFCLICLTPDNVRSPWLYFEAGAIAAKHRQARVCTFLTGISPSQVGPGPFAQYQATNSDSEGVWLLVRELNKSLKDRTHDEGLIKTAFQANWPRLREYLKEALLLYDPRDAGETDSETEAESNKYELSSESTDLLVEATADRNGTIGMAATMHGLFLQTNGKDFVKPDNARSEAKGRAAIRELIQLGLIEDRGHKGEVFRVTAEGYRVADEIVKTKMSNPD